LPGTLRSTIAHSRPGPPRPYATRLRGQTAGAGFKY
jgi:hypothetical protein